MMRALLHRLALAVLVAAPLALRADWLTDASLTAVWNDNVSNAAARSDRCAALHFDTALSLTERAGLTPSLALIYGGELSADLWTRYNGLNTVAFGPTFTLSYKGGLGPYIPTYALRARGSYSSTQEAARTGPTGSVAFVYTERLTEPMQFRFTAESSRLAADRAVYSRTGTELTGEIIRDVGTDWTFIYAVRWRRGDVLSYATPPRPDLVTLSGEREASNTFGRPFVAYTLDGTTVAGALTLSRALSQWTSFHIGFEWRETTRQPLVYINRLVSLGYTLQF